jgi:uncharacterized glyoxalase superfamily protein PhnB
VSNLSPLLAARNVRETVDYYTKMLGFKLTTVFPTPENPEYVDLEKDGMVLMFVSCESEGIGEEDELGSGVYFYMQIEGDIDEYYRYVLDNGVKLVEDIKDEPFGIRDFTIEDINGYKLTFNQSLSAR